MVVPGLGLREPGAICHLKRVLPTVRVVLIGTEEPEISCLHIRFQYIPQETAHHPSGLGRNSAGTWHLDGVFPKIREPQIAQEQTAIGMRVGAHAAAATRSKLGQLGTYLTVGVKQFRRPVALHPVFEDGDVSGVLVHLAHRHLMRAPVVLDTLAIDFFGARPTLWRAKDNHRPARSLAGTIVAGLSLDVLHFGKDLVERACHQVVHCRWLMPLNIVRRETVAAKEMI